VERAPVAIVIGASSGIGAALARTLSGNGYELGLAARRTPELESLASTLKTRAEIATVDVADSSAAIDELQKLIARFDAVDLIVISAGVGFENSDLDWEPEQETIAVNVTGFAAMAHVAMQCFLTQGHGHLVGISSLAAIRANGLAPAYGASKAFVSRYLQGLRNKVVKAKLPITVTEIQPGFVDTAMAKGPGLFWVAPPEKAAGQILRAIQRKKKHVYVARRWRIIAWLMRVLPERML